MAVILLAMEDDPGAFIRAVQSGAAGYLLKEANAAEVLCAVRRIGEGEAVCPPRLCLALFQHVARESRVSAKMPNQCLSRKLGLTKRQQELVPLVATGLTNKEIAARLNLSECTIKNHMRRLFKQVDAQNRYEAIENVRASGFTVVN